MGKLLYDGTDTTDDKTTTEQVSKDVHDSYRDYFNDIQNKALDGLDEYYEMHGMWPTCNELVDFMQESEQFGDVSKENIQPRLTRELVKQHAVKVRGKRKCSASNHNKSVSVFEKVIQE